MLPETSAVVPRMNATEIGKRLVEEPLVAVDLHHAHEVLARAIVDAPAWRRGSTNVRRPTLVNVPARWPAISRKELRQRAERQVVRLDLAGDRECGQLGHEAPVPADGALDEALVREAVEAPLLAVAGAAANTSVRSRGDPLSRKRSCRPTMSSRACRCRRSRRTRRCRRRE
jgi:hypothetical protein